MNNPIVGQWYKARDFSYEKITKVDQQDVYYRMMVIFHKTKPRSFHYRAEEKTPLWIWREYPREIMTEEDKRRALATMFTCGILEWQK
jgi:hypothetical protein